MRIIHTSDWHLGHALHDVARDHEHRAFLAWLAGAVEAEQADALIVTGDVFDTANPSAAAQQLLWDFLADLRARRPRIDVVIIGGNHDSAARLDAPERVLRSLRVRVIGGLPRLDGGALDVERLLVPLHDAGGEVAAWVIAVPFLRAADLPPEGAGEGDPLVEGVRAIYAEAIAAARGRKQLGEALVATGHLFMTGTQVSYLSERRILGGNQHALPLDLFPDDLAYVALGHLHKCQRVGGREQVRYAGSPIPLAMNEAAYRHQVLVVDLDGEQLVGVRGLDIPRAVDLVRVPARGGLPIDELVDALEDLEPAGDSLPEVWPYVEVCARLAAPEPRLRTIVEKALSGRRARLIKLQVEYAGDGASLAETVAEDLKDLDPEEVLIRRWRRDHEGDPPAALIALYHELIDEARRAEGAS
jgi:DNA repair protein SbcD/Mre11